MGNKKITLGSQRIHSKNCSQPSKGSSNASCYSQLNVYSGTELYQVGKDGREILMAIFDDTLGKFVTIFK